VPAEGTFAAGEEAPVGEAPAYEAAEQEAAEQQAVAEEAAAVDAAAAEEAAVADAALGETSGEPGVAAAAAVPAPVATSTRAPSGFIDVTALKAAAEESGLKLPDSVYVSVAAALATGKHVVLAGPAGSGKTTLALAIAKAAVQAGRSEGAAIATASPKWTARDTVGRVGDEGFTQGHVLAAAGKKKWLVIDEIERAKPDKAFGDLSSFLAGLPLSLPDGSREVAAPKDWRIVATRDSSRSSRASAALQRRFAEIRLPRPAAADLEAAVDAATEGDPAAASVVKRLLADEALDGLGAGAFLDAARYAAERNAILPASEEELEAELRTAYLDPHRAEEDDD
jgi:energy-coupling factor transporter ATP-binding protein EcfA2